MKATPKRGPGRPPKYDEPLERVQVMLFQRQRDAAEAEAAKRGVSVSEVYRDWIERGRSRK